MPHRINPTVERQKNLLEQIMYSSMFKADFKNNISFKVDDVEIIPPTFNNIEKGNAQEATTTIEQSISTKDERLFAREKELQRQERHNTKVAIIQHAMVVRKPKTSQILYLSWKELTIPVFLQLSVA